MSSIINLDKIKGLVYTEKSNISSSNGRYTFEVDSSCNKSEIKSLIKKIYNVDVKNVNIINTKPKSRRFKGINGYSSKVKKAIIKLKENQTINFA